MSDDLRTEILRRQIAARLARARQPSTPAQRIEAARARGVSPEAAARAGAADQRAQDRMTLAQEGGFRSGLTSFVQGVPFVGEWTDELADRIGPAGRGDQIRSVQDAMERERPALATGLQIGGGITGGAALALAAGPAAVAAAPTSLGAQALAAGAAGAAAGGAEGAVSGAGRNEQNRGRGALVGGALGAGMGGAASAVAPAVSRGVRNLLQRFRTSDVRTIARQFRVSPDAAQIVRSALANDDLDAAEAAIRAAGGDAMLADGGIATRQLLDDAMSAGGEATRIGREAVETRAASAGPEINAVLDNILGPPEGVRSASRSISQRTAAARQTAYERAYAQPIDYAAPTGRNIEAVLERVPPNTLRRAVDEANEAMREAGIRNMQIMAEIAPDGSVAFREMPNVRQLDEIKKALNAVAQGETDAITGRITAAGLRARRLAENLRDALTDAVPTYRTAVRLGGDKIAEQNALDLGRRVLRAGVTREEVADMARGMSREAKDSFRQGLRGFIDDTLANVQRTITDPNIDAREAMLAIKQLSSRANREKITAVLGQAQARRLFDVVERATAKLELRSAVARNSQTAIRTAGREAMAAATEPGPVGALMRGRPANAVQRVVQALTNTTPQADLARQQAIYADIARALTSIRGQDAEAAMRLVRQAMNGQPLAEAQARQIANLVAGSGALVAYQTGTRSQPMPARAQGPQ